MASLQWLVCLMTMKVTECLTQRGAPAVRDENNYMYTKNYVNKDTVNWRCSKRGCRATLKTEKESLHISWVDSTNTRSRKSITSD